MSHRPGSQKLTNLFRLIGNYRYYRRGGYKPKSAWFLARITLP